MTAVYLRRSKWAQDMVTREATGFAIGWNDRCGRDRRVKDDPKFSAGRNWTSYETDVLRMGHTLASYYR